MSSMSIKSLRNAVHETFKVIDNLPRPTNREDLEKFHALKRRREVILNTMTYVSDKAFLGKRNGVYPADITTRPVEEYGDDAKDLVDTVKDFEQDVWQLDAIVANYQEEVQHE